MYNFDAKQTGNVTTALNLLSVEKYIDYFAIYDSFATIDFDDFEIRITVPMQGSLQFCLLHNDKLIKSVVTDSVTEALPIQRVVHSLFGILMLQSFDADWDGYTIQEAFCT